MRIICVDDEKNALEMLVDTCKEVIHDAEIIDFRWVSDAVKYIMANEVDIALLDINMPEMTGLEFAKIIKETSPDTAIIFVTGYSEYALEAFKVHANGYLMKPVDKAELEKEIKHAANITDDSAESSVYIKTFGNFDVFRDGQTLSFHRNKSKELLALLVDKQGTNVTRREMAAVLWGDDNYERSRQKQLDVYINSLKADLEEFGLSDMVITGRGTLRFNTEVCKCDLYDFMKGDINAINSYKGVYMGSYPWASFTVR